MRIFSMSRHIGIMDFHDIARSLGHDTVEYSLSGHAHHMGWTQHPLPYNPNELYHKQSWTIPEEGRNADCYVTFYEGCQWSLYVNSDKPVIGIIPLRFGHGMEGRPDDLEEFRALTKEMVDRGQLRLVANNRYDQAHAEHFLKTPVRYIPSLCRYFVNCWASPDGPWATSNDRLPPVSDVCLLKDPLMGVGYRWSDMPMFSGFLELPYNTSVMSFYERSHAGYPHAVPSLEMTRSMWQRGAARHELWWVGDDRTGWDTWGHLHLADWWSGDWASVRTFGSWAEAEALTHLGVAEMRQWNDEILYENRAREVRVINQWRELCNV